MQNSWPNASNAQISETGVRILHDQRHIVYHKESRRQIVNGQVLRIADEHFVCKAFAFAQSSLPNKLIKRMLDTFKQRLDLRRENGPHNVVGKQLHSNKDLGDGVAKRVRNPHEVLAQQATGIYDRKGAFQ